MSLVGLDEANYCVPFAVFGPEIGGFYRNRYRTVLNPTRADLDLWFNGSPIMPTNSNLCRKSINIHPSIYKFVCMIIIKFKLLNSIKFTCFINHICIQVHAYNPMIMNLIFYAHFVTNMCQIFST